MKYLFNLPIFAAVAVIYYLINYHQVALGIPDISMLPLTISLWCGWLAAELTDAEISCEDQDITKENPKLAFIDDVAV